MAFFSPGFMLGAAQRATEIIDDTRERNEDLAEEIKDLTKEHSKIAAKAISVRATEDAEFTSIAKQTLLSSDEGKAILKNVENSPQTLVAIGREASKRIKGNLTPKLFNKSLLSKSTTPDGKFQNPYTLSNADLTKNPSEEAKQTEKLGFGQKVLQNLVGKKPTIEEATAGMTPEMREATLQSIRTGQPLATRDPVEFAAGQIETPVLSEAEEERIKREEERYQDRLANRRKYNEGIRKQEREYKEGLEKEKRERVDNSRLRNPAFESLLESELEIEQAALRRDALNKNLDDEQKQARKERVVAVAALSRQLYAGGYYTHGRVVTQNENLFDTSKAIYDLFEGDNKIVSLSSSEIKQLNEMGLEKYLEYRKGGDQPDQSEKQGSETVVRPEDEVTRGSIDQSRSATTGDTDEGALAAAKIAADTQAAKEEAERKKDKAEADAKAAAAMIARQAADTAEPTPQTAAGSLSRFKARQDLLRKAREAGMKLPSQAKKPKPLAQDEKKPKVEEGSLLDPYKKKIAGRQ